MCSLRFHGFEACVAYPLTLCLLAVPHTLRVRRAILGPVRAGNELSPALGTAFHISLTHDFIVGLRIIRQHRLAEPFADQGTCDQLGAGTRFIAVIEQQAISVIEIAAAFTDKIFDFCGLSRCYANDFGLDAPLLFDFSFI